MYFKFNIGTKALFGKDIVNENKSEFDRYGKSAFIVTGRSSGALSGALKHVEEILLEFGINYKVFDQINNNPSLENVEEAASLAKDFGANFIIAIGGGSPIDASKAIAVLAVNDISALSLFNNTFENKPLPIIAIPTTMGTGSEVTPYSILTRHDIKTKMSFGNEDTFPKVAFLDPEYMKSMPYDVALNTAIDAFSHSLEGYLSKRSTPISDVLALEGIGVFGSCIERLKNNELDFGTREKLLYASMLGGMVISHTGTTIVHGMGYSLTYFKDIPHGRANGLLIGEYLRFNYEAAKAKIDNVLDKLKMGSLDEFISKLDELLGIKERIDGTDLEMFSSYSIKQKSTLSNIRTVSEEDMVEVFKRTFKNF